MKTTLKLTAGVMLLCALRSSAAWAQEEPQEVQPIANLAEQAYQITNKYCHRCHIEDGGAPQFDLLNPAVLLDPKRKPPLVVPGKPEESNLWQMVGVYNAMPPDGAPQPTEEEKLTLRTWIEQGAPSFVPGAGREFLTEEMVLTAIRDDLTKVRAQDRGRMRYFSLAHLYNNRLITDFNLKLYRAALSKAINSMSRERDIAVPVAVPGTWKSVFRLDLASVGWDEEPELWLMILNAYPYGVNWRDKDLADLLDDIKRLYTADEGIGAGVPYVRADWFVSKATRGEIYEALLKLPDNIDDLEKSLGVNVKNDFKTDKLARAGFASSGVSRHNRAIDRFRGSGGSSTAYYYRSWDFGKSFGRAVLYRFPLGPTSISGDLFKEQAFEADGGEVVWSLPNGLQGYYICNAAGKKIDPAPVEIVRDLSEIAGGPQVVNGISCMGCHKRGVQPYTDSIREAVVPGSSESNRKVGQLYPPQAKLNNLINSDIRLFLRALDETIGPFLREGDDENKTVEELVNLPEPITALTKVYQAELGLEEVARELGREPSKLGDLINGSEGLQKLGLGPVATNSKIVRDMWDSREANSASVYQEAARALGLGAPVNFNFKLTQPVKAAAK